MYPTPAEIRMVETTSDSSVRCSCDIEEVLCGTLGAMNASDGVHDAARKREKACSDIFMVCGVRSGARSGWLKLQKK